jgi:hypothetical protein
MIVAPRDVIALPDRLTRKNPVSVMIGQTVEVAKHLSGLGREIRIRGFLRRKVAEDLWGQIR